MNDNENNIDRFIELEKNAKELVSELENIKKSSSIYEEAKNSLSTISNELIQIADNISSLIESLKLNTNKSNETLIQSNDILLEQININELSLKKINLSFKKFQNELINELDVTRTFIQDDNYGLMNSIQNKINDKFEKFNIRLAMGFTVIVVMIIISYFIH